MTPKLILDSEGTLKYVAEWPDEFLYIVDDHLSAQYKTDCEQAIANGIEFKDQEIKLLIYLKYGDYNLGREWKMEPLNPYDVPSGIEIKIELDSCESVCSDQCQEHGCMGREFAFIKHDPKEEVESQDGLWLELMDFINDRPDERIQQDTIVELQAKFHIERIKK